MTDWTPDTDHVRVAYLHGIAQDEANKGIEVTPAFGRGIAAQFDRWLDQVKADAWDEGHAAGARDAMQRVDWSPRAPNTPNPHRKEAP